MNKKFLKNFASMSDGAVVSFHPPKGPVIVNPAGWGILKKQNMESENTQKVNTGVYFIEFKFIPMLINLIEGGKISPKILVDIPMWKAFLQRIGGELGEYKLGELKYNVTKLSEDHVLIIYLFPTPQIAPQAKYGAIVAGLKECRCDYLTMELSVDNTWFLCGVSGGLHCNYGELNHELSMEEFGQKAIHMFYEKK